MDYLKQHPWRQLIIAPISSPIDEDISEINSDWEYLDGEMVKLGSLEHELLDIDKVQKLALSLLANESKDLRILAHLLRTMQHSGSVLEVLLALQLLSDYVDHYWKVASPVAELKKYRLTLQIIKRFENAATAFRQSASRIEQDTALELLNKLKLYWRDHKLEPELERLLNLYSLPQELSNKVESTKRDDLKQIESLSSISTIEPQTMPIVDPIEVDASNERAWKNTLFKIVEYLLEQDVSEPLGYQLRRYAIWNNITSIPIAEGNRTPLAPPSADRVASYETALVTPDLVLWKDIEHSLTVSPYWFEGHYFSAKIAKSLGYTEAYKAIKLALNNFLKRLPQLKDLYFNDGTAFCSERLIKWLDEDSVISSKSFYQSVNEDLSEALLEDNIENILQKLNNRKHLDLKNKFYDQISFVHLLEKQGFDELAQQYYFSIYTAMKNLSIFDWETSLYNQLKEKLDINHK